MLYRRGALCAFLALVLGGCQGGGANPPALNTGTALPTQVVQSGPVSPSGGAVSASIGSATLTVRVQPGGASGPGTLTLTMYPPGAGPQPLGSGRKPLTVGAHAALVQEFAVALSGATLLKPLQASLTTGAPAAAAVLRLAGSGSSVDDVDTVTWAAGTATTDLNAAFARMSLAASPSGTIYLFYTEPAAEAAGAPTPVVTVATAATLPVGMFGSATFTASEASPNGFPYLDPSFSFSLDNASLGSVNPATGVVTAGGVDGAGNVVATDPTPGRGNAHGSGRLTVSSQRPGNAGDNFTFSGTLSTTTQLVNSNPTRPQTDTATVALSSAVGAFAAVTGGGTSTVASAEADTYPLLTIKTATTSNYAYTPSGATATVAIKKTDATDSNGARYVTTYGVGNGLLDVLPEATGSFGPNNAALTYAETDPAGFARNRTANADGSYAEQGSDPLGDVQTINVNADLSAAYDARQYSGFRFTMTAPSTPPNPRIILRVFQGNTQVASFNLASWVPATLTQPSVETDADNGPKPFPASCNVPAKYGTSGNQIVQTITRADTALGNLETQTTTTYLAPRVGPVCIQLADSVQTFYDYTGQNGFVILVSGGTTPIQLSSMSETLTLQSASVEGGTTTLASGRSTSSATSNAATPLSLAAVSFARARFDRAVREKLGGMRKATFNHNFGHGGVQVL